MTVKNNAPHTSEALVATRRSAGFTLVEVVVVVGIIGLLLSLTFPALGSIRLSALNAKDISQIRQLGLAHRMYQQVYSDAFVDVGLPHGGYGDLSLIHI